MDILTPECLVLNFLKSWSTFKTYIFTTQRFAPRKVKVKVVPYTFVRRGVHVREDTYPEPAACEVGWPVPFLAAFISPELPPGTNLLLVQK